MDVAREPQREIEFEEFPSYDRHDDNGFVSTLKSVFARTKPLFLTPITELSVENEDLDVPQCAEPPNSKATSQASSFVSSQLYYTPRTPGSTQPFTPRQMSDSNISTPGPQMYTPLVSRHNSLPVRSRNPSYSVGVQPRSLNASQESLGPELGHGDDEDAEVDDLTRRSRSSSPAGSQLTATQDQHLRFTPTIPCAPHVPLSCTEALSEQQAALANLSISDLERERKLSNASLSQSDTYSIHSLALSLQSKASSSMNDVYRIGTRNRYLIQVSYREAVSKDYIVYVIKINPPENFLMDVEYVGLARYSELFEMHKRMIAKYPQATNLPFPKKKLIGNNNPSFVTDRAVELLRYFDLAFQFPELAQFWISQPIFEHVRHDYTAPF